MGNTFGMKKTTKVMKIDGETLKLKTPVKAGDVMKDHPGLVLLESEAVKHYGTRAKPLEPHKELLPKRLYFLVELPKETKPRRVRSGIVMSAKDRLESLMLTRRSASDLSILKQSNMVGSAASSASKEEEEEEKKGSSVNDVNVVDDGKENNGNGGGVRLKMRLPRAEVEKLIQDCKDDAEAAKRIMSYYKAKANGTSRESSDEGEIEENNAEDKVVLDQHVQWKGGRDRGLVKKSIKAPREKRVSFMPISEGGIQIAVAS